MIATENAWEVSLPSTEFERQALIITVPNDYKELVSPQSSLSDFPFAGVKTSLQGSNASLNDGMKVQEASGNAPLPVTQDFKTSQKTKNLHLIHQSPRIENTIY